MQTNHFDVTAGTVSRVAALVAFLLVFSGCSSDSQSGGTSVQPVAEQGEKVTATPSPTRFSSPTPVCTPGTATHTSTPDAPTGTPEPTFTATPTNTTRPSLTPPVTPTGGKALCGNKVVEPGETCDLGGICVGGTNQVAICDKPEDCEGGGVCTPVGGQPSASCPVSEGFPGTCAANCTCESERFAEFAEGTKAFVQTGPFLIDLPLTGSHTWLTGQPRGDDTIGLDGQVLVRAGDLPVVQKADGLIINEFKLQGLVCACVRGVAVPHFGGGNPCGTVATGAPFDCRALEDNPQGGLSGSGLAVTYPSVHARTIGDNVTSILFVSE